MIRSSVLAAILVILLCSSANAQSASAGCGEINVCGTQRGTSNGGAKGNTPATNSRSNAAAAQWNAIQNNLQNNVQMINQAGDAILNILRNNNSSTSAQDDANDDDEGNNTDVPPVRNDTSAADAAALEAANAAAAAARERERVNAEATQILKESQSDLDSMNGGTGNGAAVPNASAAVNALLDSDQPSNSSNSAINALLDDSAKQNPSATATASAVSGLLDINKVSDSASAFPAYASLQIPSDPQFSAAFQDSVDQPTQSSGTSLPQLLQTADRHVKDELSGLIDSGKSLASSYANSPVVQWFASRGWNGTTAPLPTAADSPETATNLAFGQAVVGLGDILEGMAAGPWGVAKGVYSYGAKMVNQMGAYLGLATAPITEQTSNAQQQGTGGQQ